MTGTRIDYKGIAKSYTGTGSVLKSISFSIEPGSFCVLLGASGAGKSTLLRMMNGLVTPDEGEITMDGAALNTSNLRQVRRRIGMVHQHFNLTPRLSAHTNILCGSLPVLPTWRSLPGLFPKDAQIRAADLGAQVGLSPSQLAQRTETLSGGQQQRVGIARAFMLSPPLILADEPVASLDPALSEQILTLLKTQAQQSGATVVCSLHQVDLALAFADRIIGLASGEIVFDQSAKTLDAATIARLYDYSQPTGVTS